MRRQVAASHTVICGDFPVFSTTALPEKPINRAFRAAWCGKSAFFLPYQPPPSYVRERLASLAIAEYVRFFFVYIVSGVRQCRLPRQGRGEGASAVVAALCSGKSLHQHDVWTCHPHSAASQWVQGVCVAAWRGRHGAGRRRSSGSGVSLCPRHADAGLSYICDSDGDSRPPSLPLPCSHAVFLHHTYGRGQEPPSGWPST